MQQPFSAPLPSRAALAAVLFALAAAPALADKKQPAPLIGTNAVNVIQVSDLSGTAYFRGYKKNGDNWDNKTPSNPGRLFDGDLSTGVATIGGEAGDVMILDFSPLLDADHLMYVHNITVGFGENNMLYSIYYSETDTNPGDANWVAVAESETTAGLKIYPVCERVKAIKYVFENSHPSNPLSEFQVSGYKSTVPKVVSNKTIAKIYKADGTMTGNNGTDAFGGGSGIGNLFNGNFNDSVYIGPNGRLSNGGYLILDFSDTNPGGWFITEIKTGSKTDHMYSLYYSMDGLAWKNVKDGTGIKFVGQKSFNVYDTAVYVKCVFDQVGGWTASFNELQVWGMDPDDVYCTHPSFTDWTFVEGSASCLEPGIDEQFCSVCGKRFTRKQEVGLGHDFVSHLLIPGVYRKFGSGYVDCTRCDWRLDFPLDTNSLWDTMPLDLVTNRVNGTQIGRVSVMGQFNFTEITVTSTGNGADEPDPNQNWGVSPVALFDNNWTMSWQNHWYSIRASLDSDPHVDYVFGTEIDLAWIDFATDNANYTNRFFSVDDDTEEETLLAETSALTTDETHMEGVEQIVFSPVSFAATEDETPGATKTYYAVVTNETGAFYVATNGLESFEADVDYYEISHASAAYLVLDGGKYKPANIADGFATNATYVVQSATADRYYTQESDGKYVSAGALTEFSTTTTYYRTTGVTMGDDLATIVDTHTDATRVQIRFYAQPVKHLRLRQVKSDGKVRAPMYVSELRPWGTVKGAGDLRYRKETLLIFR